MHGLALSDTRALKCGALRRNEGNTHAPNACTPLWSTRASVQFVLRNGMAEEQHSLPLAPPSAFAHSAAQTPLSNADFRKVSFCACVCRAF